MEEYQFELVEEHTVKSLDKIPHSAVNIVRVSDCEPSVVRCETCRKPLFEGDDYHYYTGEDNVYVCADCEEDARGH